MLSEVPEGWTIKVLSDIAVVKGGKRMPKGAKFSEKPTDYPYIRVSDFANGSISTKDIQFVSPEHQAQIARYTISKDDIYISIAGTLGVVGTVPEELDGAQLTENAAKISIQNTSMIDREFLARVLQSGIGQSQIDIKKGIGGGVPKLALFRVGEINLPIPPLNEQQRIAEILASIDAGIRATQAVIEQAERVKRGLMEELLTGGLGSEAIERGEVPEGWCSHAPISNYIKNKTQKWNGYEVLPYIGLEHIEKDSGRLLGFGESGDVTSSKNVFEEGDVLFGKLRPNLRKYWRANKRGICSTDILILRSQKEMLNEYLFVIVQSEPFLAFAENDAAGTKMPRTSWKRLETIELPLPPLKEQKRIAEIILSFDELIGQQLLVAEQQTRTKRGLMDDLLTGKVRTV